MQEITFRTELDRIGVELKLVPNQEKQCLDLWQFDTSERDSTSDEPIWKFLGAIKLEHIIIACNRDKLSCKYGHPVEVSKRSKKK